MAYSLTRKFRRDEVFQTTPLRKVSSTPGPRISNTGASPFPIERRHCSYSRGMQDEPREKVSCKEGNIREMPTTMGLDSVQDSENMRMKEVSTSVASESTTLLRKYNSATILNSTERNDLGESPSLSSTKLFSTCKSPTQRQFSSSETSFLHLLEHDVPLSQAFSNHKEDHSTMQGYSLSHKCNMVAIFNESFKETSLHRSSTSPTKVQHATSISSLNQSSRQFSTSKLDFDAVESLTDDESHNLNSTNSSEHVYLKPLKVPAKKISRKVRGEMKRANLQSKPPSLAALSNSFSLPTSQVKTCEGLLNKSQEIYRQIVHSLEPQYKQAAAQALKINMSLKQEDIHSSRVSSNEPDFKSPSETSSSASNAFPPLSERLDIDLMGYRGMGYYSVLSLVDAVVDYDRVLCGEERLSKGLRAIHQFILSSYEHEHLFSEDLHSASDASEKVSPHPTPEWRTIPSGSSSSKTSFPRRRKCTKRGSQLLNWIERRYMSNKFWRTMTLTVDKSAACPFSSTILPLTEDIFRDGSRWCMSQPYCHGGSIWNMMTWIDHYRRTTPVSRRRGGGRLHRTGHGQFTISDRQLCDIAGHIFYDVGHWIHYLHHHVGLTLHGEWTLIQQKTLGTDLSLDQYSGLHAGLILIHVDEFTADELQRNTPLTIESDKACHVWRESIYKMLLQSNDSANVKVNFVMYNLGRARDKYQLHDDDNLFLSSCVKDWQALCYIVRSLLDFIQSPEVKTPLDSYIQTLLSNNRVATLKEVDNIVDYVTKPDFIRP